MNVKNVLCFTMWTSLVKDFVDNIILREWYKNIVEIKNAKHTRDVKILDNLPNFQQFALRNC